MLTRVHDWLAFSNHTVGDGGSTSNSLEGIHDGIHVYVGGSGHMGSPDVAGRSKPVCVSYYTISLMNRVRSHLFLAPCQCR